MLVGWVGWANVCFALCTQSGECRDVESGFLRQKLQVASSVLCSLKSETARTRGTPPMLGCHDLSRSVTQHFQCNLHSCMQHSVPHESH